MIIIYGKSGSGKDLFAELLTQENPSLHIMKRPTTRPKRDGGDVSHYDYLTNEEWCTNRNIKYDTVFRGWNYGVYNDSLLDSKGILIIDGKTAHKIKRDHPKTVLIEIKANDDVRLNRCYNRECYNEQAMIEAKRRLVADNIDYSQLPSADINVENNINNILFKELKNEVKRVNTLLEDKYGI